MALTKASLIDLNGQELILDADADTSITADTDDQIDIKVGGSDTVHMGLTTYNASDRIVLTNTSGNASMAIVAGTSGESSIFMADGTSGDASYRGYLQYQHANDNWNFGTAATLAMKIDSAGHVTKPLQPAVLVTKSSSQLNIAVGSSVTQVFDSEIFDVNGDFSSNTFTAPVTGKYLVNLQIRYQSIPTDVIYIQTYLATSNGTRYMGLFGSGSSWFNSAASYFRDGQSLVIDMDANDTFTVITVQSGGTQQIDIGQESYLSVALLS
jgi:hypothetical protein